MSKELRNSGKAYTSMSKIKLNEDEKKKGRPLFLFVLIKIIFFVLIKSFNVLPKITDENRQVIFNEYWNTGDLEAQRHFLYNSI